MATDIALALGALALAAPFVPTGLKPLLLTLAIVDDIGAIVVVTFAYGHRGDLVGLVWAAAAVAAVLVADRAHVRSIVVYVGLGALLWFALWRAGVEPAIAGVRDGRARSGRAVPAAARGERGGTPDRGGDGR